MRWQANDDKHVTILNRLIGPRDNEGERVVTREPDPRHLDDLLREACGLNSKSQEVTTAGDKEADSYDETLLSANKATAFGSPTMRLVFFLCSRHITVRVRGGLTCETHGQGHCWCVELTETIHSWTQSVNSQNHHIQDEVDRHNVYENVDWAQDQERKSVACVVTMMGTHCLRGQVASKTAPALSSSEAEFAAQVKGASAGLHTDSNANKELQVEVGSGIRGCFGHRTT